MDDKNYTVNIFKSLITIGSFCIVILVTGCASITGNANQTVSVQTKEPTGAEVVGANCELTNSKGKWFITTPGSVGVHRSNDDMQIICRKDDYQQGKNAIVSETKGMMFGNIIFGGGIGAIVDHNTGAAYEYPSFFQILMSRIKPAPVTSSEFDKAPTQDLSKKTSSSSSLEERLRELKRLFDDKLITEENYKDQQRVLLQK